MTVPNARRATIALIAASIPLAPDADTVHAALTRSPLDWDDVFYLADGHGITPLLYRIWHTQGILSLIPESARQLLEQAYRDNRTRNEDALRDFRDLCALMENAGVEILVLKGLPLLFQLYPDPAERVLYDFDFLAPDELAARRGYDALGAAGFTPVPTKPGATVQKHLPSLWRANGFVRRGYLFDVAQPRPVEMHLSLWDRHWRGLDVPPLREVWARSERVAVSGMTVRVLSPEDTMIHLCVHLATHLVEREARVGQAIDVARFLAAQGDTLEWDHILEASARAHVSRFVYLALCAVNYLTGAPLPPPTILNPLRTQTPPALRVWVERQGAHDLLALDYRETDLSRAYELTFAATQSWQEKIRVLRFALFPSSDALRAEYGGRSPWLYARRLLQRGRIYLQSLRRRHARSN